MTRWAVLLTAVLAGVASADVVHLTNGTSIDGQIRRTADGYVVTATDGATRIVAFSDIQSIEWKRTAPATKPAEGRISAPAARPPAPHQLSPAQIAAQKLEARKAAGRIAPLISAGNFIGAAAVLANAMNAAPHDPGLWYLQGLALFGQNQLVPARKAFEQVEKQLPDHAPTHNDLAVILWKTHALMPALAEYDKAMLAAPGDRVVLDNVAEALHALPVAYQKNALTRKVAGHFIEQDAELQKRMAKLGLHRVGSQWIGTDEYQRLKSAQAAAVDKGDSYQSDLLALQTRLMDIDRKIANDTSLMNSIRQEQTQVAGFDSLPREGYAVPGETGIIHYPLPPRYFDLEKEVSALKAEKLMKTRQLEQLPKSLLEARKRAVRSDYTGKQQMIGPEGTPGLPPTTQPTTRPSVS